MDTRPNSAARFAIIGLYVALSSACTDEIFVDDMGEMSNNGTVSETDSSTTAQDTQTETRLEDAGTATDFETDTETDLSSDSGPCGDGSQSRVIPRPADVIVVVDNSAKMEQEVTMTKNGLEGFWSALQAAQTTPQLTLLSAPDPPTDPKEKNGLCLPRPLGSGACPEDSNPPEYVHLPLSIGSKEALSVLHQNTDSWKHRRRPGADLHILVISDDDSRMTAQEFIEAMSALTPPVEAFFFHAIAAGTDRDADCVLDPPGPCCEVSAHIGAVYQQLVKTTGGVFADLCRQEFASEFADIAENIVQKSCR